MTLAAAVLLGACVAAELAALGLAVVVVVRGYKPGWRLYFSTTVIKRARFSHRLRTVVLKTTVLARSPLARLLAFAVLADVLGAVCSHVANMGPRPRVGWHRVAYHLADALVMAWPLAVARCASKIFDRPRFNSSPLGLFPSEARDGLQEDGGRHGWRREEHRQHEGGGTSEGRSGSVPEVQPGGGGGANQHHRLRDVPRQREDVSLVRLSARAPAVSFSFGTLALVLAHPVPRVWTQRTLHAHELLCVAVTWWAVWRGRSLPWRVEHRALVVLASFEFIVATVGPFAGDAFQRWPVVGAVLYLAAFSTVAVVLLVELRRGRFT